MSRVGKQPILIPDGVDVTILASEISVNGPKGNLTAKIHPDIKVQVHEKNIICSVARQSKKASALWGTTRAVIANLVKGVAQEFEKKLELHGVGYRAKLTGKDLELQVGYSHPVVIPAREGIQFVVEKETIIVRGPDTVRVGQVAAEVRRIRPPEPYKGKGIRYVGERVRRKVGKVVGATTT